MNFNPEKCSIPIFSETGTGFDSLFKRGFIAHRIYKHLPTSYYLRPLMDRAEQHDISASHAADLLRTIWNAGNNMNALRGRGRSALDRCLRACIIIHLTIITTDGRFSGLERWANAIPRRLSGPSNAWMLHEIPEFLLWMSLLCATLADSHAARLWYVETVADVRRVLQIFGFDEARRICETFVWAARIDARAKQIWDESLTLKSPTPPFGSRLLEDDFLSYEDTVNQGSSRYGEVQCCFCRSPICPCALRSTGRVLPDAIKALVWSATANDMSMYCGTNWYDYDE